MIKRHSLALSGAVLLIVFLAMTVQSCSYLTRSSAALADGAGAYCDEMTPASREALRQTLDAELKAEGITLGLGCHGEPMSCVGANCPTS